MKSLNEQIDEFLDSLSDKEFDELLKKSDFDLNNEIGWDALNPNDFLK